MSHGCGNDTVKSEVGADVNETKVRVIEKDT